MSLKRIDLSLGERLLYPSKPIVVSAEYDGEVSAMFASWWTQLSFKPFLIGVAIGPERYTYKLASKAGKYGLNLLGFDDVVKAPYLGDVSTRFMKDKLRRGGFKIFYGEELGVPLIESAYIAIEVSLRDICVVGDHDLFIGEVYSIYASDLIGEDGLWNVNELRPIFYMGRFWKGKKMYRRFVTWNSVNISNIEYAPYPLKNLSFKRSNLRKKIFNVLKSYGELKREDALEIVSKILGEYGIGVEDAVYYLEEAVRNDIVKIIE